MDQAILDRLKASVTAETDAGDAIVLLMQGFADQLRQSAGDAAAVSAVADQMDAKAKAWADAATANTPAA